MTALLLEGWLVKDGNSMGGWKNRYCSLTFANNQFTLDYFVSDDKAEKKGTFVFARNSGFTKVADSGDNKNCFSLEVADSGSLGRKAGARVTFSSPTVEGYVLWEKAFLNAKAPVGIMPGVGKSFGKHELLVLGASGNVGAATIRSLAAYSKEYIIRAGVRDISSAKNAPLAATGAKLVAANMANPKALVTVLNGVKVVFVVVPPTADRATLSIGAIKACKDAGVQHVVVVSGMSADKVGTIFADQFTAIEQYTKTAGIPYTIVRLPLFMENVLGQMQSIASNLQFYSALDSNKRYSAASVGDIGEAVAKIMASPQAYVNKTLHFGGTPVCENDYAVAFSGVLEKAVSHTTVTYPVHKQILANMGMEEWQCDGIIELEKLIANDEIFMVCGATDLHLILKRELASPATLAAHVAPGLRAIRAASEYEAKMAAEEAAANLEALKLQTAEQTAAKKAAAAAAHLKATKQNINNGGLVLKKMSTETGFKARFVGIDESKKILCW